MDKRKLCFLGINALLLIAVGVILGICLPIGNNNSLLMSFILLLVTLCIPSILFLTVKDASSGYGIVSILFTVANVATLIVFMCLNDKVDLKTIGIVEACILGAYLVSIMICIALTHKEETKE